MGIKGLYKFIKKKASSCVTERSIDFFSGKTAALDGNAFLYKYQHFHGKDIAKISEDMQGLGQFLRDNHVLPVFVFDGPGLVPEKERVLRVRQARRDQNTERAEELQANLQQLKGRQQTAEASGAMALKRKREEDNKVVSGDDGSESSAKRAKPAAEPAEAQPPTSSTITASDAKQPTTLDSKPAPTPNTPADDPLQQEIAACQARLEAVEKQALRVTQEDVLRVIQDLTARGFVCLHAHSETDFVLAQLARQGLVDLVFGDDGDFLAHGVRCVVRNLHRHRSSRELLECYDRDELLRALSLSDEQFVDFCILCESDYSTTITNIGPQKGYQGIVKHKCIERLAKSLQGSTRYTYEPTFLSEVQGARRLFLHPPSVPPADWDAFLVRLHRAQHPEPTPETKTA